MVEDSTPNVGTLFREDGSLGGVTCDHKMATKDGAGLSFFVKAVQHEDGSVTFGVGAHCTDPEDLPLAQAMVTDVLGVISRHLG